MDLTASKITYIIFFVDPMYRTAGLNIIVSINLIINERHS
jgi:hypothetical protein